MTNQSEKHSPLQIAAIDHVVVRVADLERSLSFYRDALGCTVERELAELGLLQLRAGGSLIDLVPVGTPLGDAGGAPPPAAGDGGRNMDHFALQLEAFDEEELRAHLAGFGIEMGEVATRYGALGNGPSVYLRDPDGNTVELKGPPATGS